MSEKKSVQQAKRKRKKNFYIFLYSYSPTIESLTCLILLMFNSHLKTSSSMFCPIKGKNDK